MAIWTVTAKKADFDKISSHFGIDPVVARVIRNRDIITDEEIYAFLNGGEESFFSPLLLCDMEKAADIIWGEIQKKSHIRVIGDYDVDGVTATCILVKGLKGLGADVDYAIPNRVTDGYGVNENLINEAISDGVNCIITCDNGIAAGGPLELAMKNGMRVVVTDHHEVPYDEKAGVREYIYPDVDAVVNPKRHDSEYPFPSICGAFVAYKLITALYDKFIAGGNNREMDAAELLAELRELAGLGTVCDVMELKSENRALVKLTLNDMKNSRNIGIRALLKVCGIEASTLSAYHLGFIIGPCINATGRLDDATMSLELLLSEDFGDALVKATELKRLNELRKEMTEEGLEAALKIIERDGLAQDKVIVVYVPELHESLAGIIAGRIKEKYYKPAFVLTKGEDGLKGSGRSIEAYHMYDSMNEIADVFTKFGGHAMAAGLSINETDIDILRKRLNDNCRLTEADLQEKVKIDVPMPFNYVSEKLIEDLKLLEPHGTGNPKPVFAQKDAIVLSAKKMGKAGNMAKIFFTLESGGRYEGVIFRNLEAFESLIGEKYGDAILDKLYASGYTVDDAVKMDIIYSPSVNEYMGRRTLQYTINAFK